MNFFERLRNFYYISRTNYVTAPAFDEMFDRPGKLRGTVIPLNFPKIDEIRKEITSFFVNSNELLDLPRPSVSKLHHIGGIAIKTPEPLDKKTARIFEIARKGVVLFSFGSIVDTQNMNTEIRDAFLNSFSRFPEYEFVWKYTGSAENQADVFKNHSNVHPIEWLDQTAILNHPKTRAFISHVGLNSLNEAAHFGVPLLAIPFFGDQTYNTAMVQNLKIGIPLSKRNINVNTLTSALTQLLADDNVFSKRAKTVSRMLNSPAEKFVHRVELATRFPDELRRQQIPDLNLFVYYSLDVISFLFLISFALLTVLFYTLKGLISFLTVNLKVKTL